MNTPRSRISSSIEALEQRIAPATLIGLTKTNLLVTFDSGDAEHLLHSVKITGVPKGEDIVSIDARPANGVIYALSNKSNVYTISPETGRATSVGASGLTLDGKAFAIDFNPTVDRLRVVSDLAQNFRINPATGAAIDGDAGTSGIQPDTALAYDAGDANAGKTPAISAVAYDRNAQGNTTTTLFGIDTVLNTLVRVGGTDGMPSPNGGLLFTVGALGFDVTKAAGFEIAPDGTAYAAMTVKGKTMLFTIDLATGAATPLEKIGTGKVTLDAVTALPHEEIVYGVTTSNRLVSFHASDPGHLDSVVALRGLIVGETIRGIDFRPATGELFAQTSTNRIVEIDPATGEVTQLGAPIVTSPQFNASSVSGFDFNPTVDRLRLVNTNDDNLRFNPLTYAPVDSDANSSNGNTPDTALSYIATDPNVGDNPNVVGVAYDRNDTNAATATTLWGIDSSNDILVRQGAIDGNAADAAGGGSPNGGLLTTIGSLGVDVTDQVGFDISGAGVLGQGAALVVAQLQGETVSKLFSINLNSSTTNQPAGALTLIGTVGTGEVLTAMAIAPQLIEFATPTITVKEKAGTFANIVVKRTGGSDGIATVQFNTFDGSTFAGLDYTSQFALTVTFNPGETFKTVQVEILGDTLAEGPETVGLSLSAVGGGSFAQLGVTTNGLLVIH